MDGSTSQRRRLAVVNPQDFGAGLFLLICAAAVWYFGGELKPGTAFRMGPGYVPNLLAWIIGGFGIVLTVRGVMWPGQGVRGWPVNAMVLVLGSIVLFGLTIERLGLLVASLIVVLLSSIAAPEYRWRQSVVAALCLAAFACALFPFALQLPLRTLPW